MKRILIVIDGSENDAESLATAAGIADTVGAHLTVAHPRVAKHSIANVGELTFAGDDSSHSEAAEASAKAAFDTVCGDRPEARFQIYEANGEAIITALGHAFDLVVVERLSREEGPAAGNLNAALFETGRSVLIAPPASTPQAIARPAIAWNGTAQSARAIKSAIPLLQPSGAVVLLVGSGAGAVATEAIVDYLAAHEVAAVVQSYQSEKLTARARGRAVIAAAREAAASLLVLGAFGESRPQAIAGLGRATRKIVTAAPMPVLLQS